MDRGIREMAETPKAATSSTRIAKGDIVPKIVLPDTA
jgi:hypothetical protein